MKIDIKCASQYVKTTSLLRFVCHNIHEFRLIFCIVPTFQQREILRNASTICDGYTAFIKPRGKKHTEISQFPQPCKVSKHNWPG